MPCLENDVHRIHSVVAPSPYATLALPFSPPFGLVARPPHPPDLSPPEILPCLIRKWYKVPPPPTPGSAAEGGRGHFIRTISWAPR